VEYPQTPASNRPAVPEQPKADWRLAGSALVPAHLALDAQQLLHVVSNFVGQDVGFGEFSGGAEALLQFVIKA